MIGIGETVPDHELEIFQDGQFRNIRFSDYRGKWLTLVFYPADFTFICPTELGELADYYEAFEEINAEIISVSTDTVFSHKVWHEQSETIAKIKFPMLADPTGELCREFGTYINEQGISLRGTFIIDPDGVVKTFEVHDNSIGRSAVELLRKLRAAIHVHNNDGVVCPASWEPNKETLTPDVTLVGKI